MRAVQSSWISAIRPSPADPHLWTFCNIKAWALTGLGQYEEAEYWARVALRQPGATFWSDLALVSALGYLGKLRMHNGPEFGSAALAECVTEHNS